MQKTSGIGSVGEAYVRAAKAAVSDTLKKMENEEASLTAAPADLAARTRGVIEANTFTLNLFSDMLDTAVKGDDARTAATGIVLITKTLGRMPESVLDYVRETPSPTLEEVMAAKTSGT
jgi:hypothetical protein